MKTLFTALFLTTFLIIADAQKMRSDIFNDDEVVFFGIDYSNAKMIGKENFPDIVILKEYYFEKWNSMMFEQRDKFNIKKYYDKDVIEYDFGVVTERNAAISLDDIVIERNYEIEKEQLMNMISQYDSERQKEGLGMVFIVESLNKPEEAAFVWLTFFDISTKKILMARRMKGSPGGFGRRNYWIRPFYNIMKQSDKLWRKWSQEY
ncbi:MAG: hypothetical protein ACI9XO_001814 [Paraglaciecola sp.]|jgi:hypothetical protein